MFDGFRGALLLPNIGTVALAAGIMKGRRGVECIGIDLRTFFPEYVRQHVRIDQCPADVPAAMDAGRIEGLLMLPVLVEDGRQLVGLESVETVYFLGSNRS